MKMWWEDQSVLRIKDTGIVVKLYDDAENFKQSVMIPTVYYPLNSNSFKVFHYKNTEEVEDTAILEIIDAIKYKPGHCYTNTAALVTRLQEAGYNAKSYVGWLFTNGNEVPVHHCWCVLDDNRVIDFGDEFSVMLSGENGKHFKNANSLEETRLLTADFVKWAITKPNSLRLEPVGTPTPFLFYVGCECEANMGRKIYQNLIRQYPTHECERNCDEEGRNPLFKLMCDMNIID